MVFLLLCIQLVFIRASHKGNKLFFFLWGGAKCKRRQTLCGIDFRCFVVALRLVGEEEREEKEISFFIMIIFIIIYLS